MESGQFRSKGLEIHFWDASAPELKYKGVLRVDDGNNASLRLVGPSNDLSKFDRDRHGIIRAFYTHIMIIK